MLATINLSLPPNRELNQEKICMCQMNVKKSGTRSQKSLEFKSFKLQRIRMNTPSMEISFSSNYLALGIRESTLGKNLMYAVSAEELFLVSQA